MVKNKIMPMAAFSLSVLCMAAGSSFPTSNPVLALDAAPIPARGCIECFYCGIESYDLSNTPPMRQWLGDDSGGCYAHNCPLEWCDVRLPDEELGNLWEAVRTFQGDDLAWVVQKYRDHVAFNSERRAVQFSSCGVLIGNIPLTKAQVSALED